MIEKVAEVVIHKKPFDIYGSVMEPLFLAVDVARAIGYSVGDTNKMLQLVDDHEKMIGRIFWSSKTRSMWFLTEYGLYEVLMQSRKPIAKIFKNDVKRALRDLRLSDVGIGAPTFEDGNEIVDDFYWCDLCKSWWEYLTGPGGDAIDHECNSDH